MEDLAVLELDGVFEVAVRVKDLARAERFYVDVLGLRSGLRDEPRSWHFLWVGDRRGMVVLQEDRSEWPAQHLAFTVTPEALESAAKALAERGVATEGPITHDWMSGRSLYFDDPDGHALELFAPHPRR